MKNLLLSAAIAALIASPALAQDITNSPGSAASGSNSNANSGSVSGAVNGPIDSSVRVGPVTAVTGPSSADSNSSSGAVATSNTSSTSFSEGGDARSNSSATGGTSSATTGASTSAATANPNANNAGNAQNITFNTTNPDHLKTVPQVYAPALTTTLSETCMGSTSGGISVMGFGGTLGTTWEDDDCKRRLNAREMANTLGDREAARALLCQDASVAAAYAAVGQPCNYPAPKEPRQPYQAQLSQNTAPPPAPTPPVPPTKEPVTMQPIPNPASSEADGEKG